MACFKFDIPQALLGPPTRQVTVESHCRNFARICDRVVQEGEVDILLGCEVGGPRGGFRRQGIYVWDILERLFGSTVSVTEIDNYIAVCGLPTSSSSLHGSPRTFTFPAGREVEAVIT